MTDKSSTPIMDAAARWGRIVDQDDHGPPHELLVYLDNARQLERELSQYKEKAEALDWLIKNLPMRFILRNYKAYPHILRKLLEERE